jgi:hypothetical protein
MVEPVAEGVPRVRGHKTAHRERPPAQIILQAAWPRTDLAGRMGRVIFCD